MSKASMPTRTSTALVAVVFLIAGMAFHSLIQASERGDSPAEVSHTRYGIDPADTLTLGNDPGSLQTHLSATFVGLARRVTPAVVQIEVRRLGSAPSVPIRNLPAPFREFFDIPEGSSPSPTREEMAGGTGFIISSDGYILTNAHVVDRAEKISVNLVDHTTAEAGLVGSDPTTDLAVIKIEGTELPTLAWGESGGLSPGEPVMAVGNPGFSGATSLDYTVTTGIVSAVGRPLSIIRQSLSDQPDLAGYAIENFIQTDAVINPGNSGGPLVDLWGRVVGVNSAIASSDGYYQGYGFAIPADLAKKVSSDLIAHGRVVRGWLGVSVTEVSSEDAEVYRLPRIGGVLVQEVARDGPGRKAGLKVEDAILSLGGVPIQDPGDLQEKVLELGPGARTELEVYREGRPLSLTVRLGEAPMPEAPTTPQLEGETGPEGLLGMTLTDLSPSLARELGFSSAEGAVITEVRPWGPAMRKGIRSGQRVLSVYHTSIHSAREFRQVLSGMKGGDVVTLEVESPGGGTRIVNVRGENR